jgi:hypothetical protein
VLEIGNYPGRLYQIIGLHLLNPSSRRPGAMLSRGCVCLAQRKTAQALAILWN